jgi:hypothetical protein
MRGAVIAACALAATAACKPAQVDHAGDPPAVTAGQPVYGKLTVGGEPVRAAEVALLEGERVLATADAAAEYSIQVPAGAKPTRLLVRLYEPVAGAIVVVAATGRPTNVDVPASKIAELSGDVHLPSGTTADGAQLALTPRLAEVTPLAMLTAGTGPSTRPALVTHPLTATHFSQRVVEGTWQIRIDRMVDGPLGSTPPNLTLDKLTANGAPPGDAPGGPTLTVDRDLHVDATMKIVGDGR